MYPIFIAHGPAFKQNFESPVFNNVDIYPLMCYILQIIPAINNGSLENVKLMLSDMDHCEYITSKYRDIYKIDSLKKLNYSFFKYFRY